MFVLSMRMREKSIPMDTTYAWFNSTRMLPCPPGQPPGQVQPFGPGGGQLFETVFFRV